MSRLLDYGLMRDFFCYGLAHKRGSLLVKKSFSAVFKGGEALKDNAK
jgi:hypothetical protein